MVVKHEHFILNKPNLPQVLWSLTSYMLMYFKKNQLIVFKIRGSNWQHIWYYTVSAFLFYKINDRVSFTHVMVNLWLNTIDAWLNLINTRYDTCINDICWNVMFPLLMFTINLIISIKRTEQYHHIFISLSKLIV